MEDQKVIEAELRPIKVELKKDGLQMQMNKEDFALALKTWRLRHGYTQRQVAARWGCNRFTIMRAENTKNLTWEMAYRLFARLADELRQEGVDTTNLES